MGELIRFPIERRSAVLGTALSSASPGGAVQVTVTSGAPNWWSKVPAVTYVDGSREMWMKLGLAPTTRAKRHRVIAIQQEDVAGAPVLVALAACGRRAPLTHLFNDPWSGGDCAACRSKGWR